MIEFGALQESYSATGICYAQELITSAEAQALSDTLEQLSGLRREDALLVAAGQKLPYYNHGAVARTPALWSILMHPSLLEILGVLLSTPRVIPGIDTAGMHASETKPHRDLSARELPSLAAAPFRGNIAVTRVILYPNSPGTQFGFLPGSHLIEGDVEAIVSQGRDSWCWLTLGGRDVAFFDPRLIHAGALIKAAKPMIVLTYGDDGPQGLETYFHSRIQTSGLGFSDPPSELMAQLSEQHLYLSGIDDEKLWASYERIWPGHR